MTERPGRGLSPFFAPEVIEAALLELSTYDGDTHDAVGDAQHIVDQLRLAGFRLIRTPESAPARNDR